MEFSSAADDAAAAAAVINGALSKEEEEEKDEATQPMRPTKVWALGLTPWHFITALTAMAQSQSPARSHARSAAEHATTSG